MQQHTPLASQRIARKIARGLSLLEVIAAVTVIGILVMIALPRFGTSGVAAKRNGCFTNKANIELQSQLWFRNKAAWPDSDLDDIMADSGYFPDGEVTCPVDGSAYEFDSTTQRVRGHTH